MRSATFLVAAVLACAILPSCTEPDEPNQAGQMVKAIGPDGGVLEAGSLRVTIPAGALTALTEFTLTATGDGPPALGVNYSLRPQVPLATPITLAYTFSGGEVSGRDPNQLVIGRDGGGAHTPLPRTDIDFDTQVVTCTDDSIAAYYGLMVSSSIPGADSDTDTDTDPGTDTDPSSSSSDTAESSSTSGDTDGTSSTGDDSTGSGSETGTTEGTTGDGACNDGDVNPGEVCFIEGLAFDAPAGPRALLTTDVNGDGDIDLVVAGGSDNTIDIRTGNGSGILVADSSYPVGANPSSLALADLDGMNGPDLIVTHQDDHTVGVLLSNGDGTFAAVVNYPVGSNGPLRVSVADIDEDTFLDVAVAKTSNDIALLGGDGTGALGAATAVSVGGAALDVFAADFSGNDNLDLVSIIGSDLVIAAGNGAGLFGAPATTAIGSATTAFAIADFNGDGDLDAAVTSDGLVTIALGNGVGGFGGGVPFAVGAGTTAITAADVNADGDLDLITVDATDQVVTVLTGNGAGSFDESTTFAVGQAPSAVAVADFNGDGVGDIAVTNTDDDNTTLLLSDP